ncbi:MAG: DUF924 family protein [Brachymonas sp.]|nr:DUF924 family protein [Brachymonas sp.]
MQEEVLTFWFEETEPKMWWVADADLDTTIERRFGKLLTQAIQGELYAWRQTPRGRLAEIIVLDQFSRNIYRNTPTAFAQDPMALVLSQEAVAAGTLEHLPDIQRAFLLLPYMHSESSVIHVEAERLFRDHAPAGNYEYEIKHKAVVDRFGRYPHRNEALGRTSTPEEIEFLKQPGSRF